MQDCEEVILTIRLFEGNSKFSIQNSTSLVLALNNGKYVLLLPLIIVINDNLMLLNI